MTKKFRFDDKDNAANPFAFSAPNIAASVQAPTPVQDPVDAQNIAQELYSRLNPDAENTAAQALGISQPGLVRPRGLSEKQGYGMVPVYERGTLQGYEFNPIQAGLGITDTVKPPAILAAEKRLGRELEPIYETARSAGRGGEQETIQYGPPIGYRYDNGRGQYVNFDAQGNYGYTQIRDEGNAGVVGIISAFALPGVGAAITNQLVSAGVMAAGPAANAVGMGIANAAVNIAAGQNPADAIKNAIVSTGINVAAPSVWKTVNNVINNPMVTKAVVDAGAAVLKTAAAGGNEKDIKRALTGSLVNNVTTTAVNIAFKDVDPVVAKMAGAVSTGNPITVINTAIKNANAIKNMFTGTTTPATAPTTTPVTTPSTAPTPVAATSPITDDITDADTGGGGLGDDTAALTTLQIGALNNAGGGRGVTNPAARYVPLQNVDSDNPLAVAASDALSAVIERDGVPSGANMTPVHLLTEDDPDAPGGIAHTWYTDVSVTNADGTVTGYRVKYDPDTGETFYVSHYEDNGTPVITASQKPPTYDTDTGVFTAKPGNIASVTTIPESSSPVAPPLSELVPQPPVVTPPVTEVDVTHPDDFSSVLNLPTGLVAPAPVAPAPVAPAPVAPAPVAPAPVTSSPEPVENLDDFSTVLNPAPGTSAPGTSAPGTSVPGTSVPGTSVPGTSVPGTSAPGTSAPVTPVPETPLVPIIPAPPYPDNTVIPVVTPPTGEPTKPTTPTTPTTPKTPTTTTPTSSNKITLPTTTEPTYSAKDHDLLATWLGGTFTDSAPKSALAALLLGNQAMNQENQLFSALREASGVDSEKPSPNSGFYAYGTEPTASDVLAPYMNGGTVHTMATGGKMMTSPLMAATGGDAEHKGSHYVQGAGGGQDDLIPAKLADGEYVFDAEIVAALGDGSNKRGAEILDQWREAIRKHKRSGPIGTIPPKAKSPLAYMKGIK